jgi:hypothetical protein
MDWFLNQFNLPSILTNCVPVNHAQLTPWRPSPSWEADNAELLKKCPCVCGKWRFITTLKRSCTWSHSWAKWIHFISFQSVLLWLDSYLTVSTGLSPSDFVTTFFYTHCLFIPFLKHAPPISACLIWLFLKYLMKVEIVKFAKFIFYKPHATSP